MKWTRGYRSDQVDDRRAQGASGGGGRRGGVSAALPIMLFQKFGFPGLIVGAAVLYFSGGLGGGPATMSAGGSSGQSAESLQAEEPQVEFVSFVLDDVQKVWQQTMQGYRPARMVLFRGQTPSACGMGQAAMGPFYCPGDRQVYIDLSFYDELRRRFGAPGDFAQAYVIAHEIGHHIQNQTGASDRVHRAPKSQQQGDGGLSVRLELQADCYAGVWAHSAGQRDLLEVGDVEEALTAAAAIGDDNIQRQSGGRVAPESWSHGSSQQRVRWFKTGYQSGDPQACDTFNARNL